MIYDSALINYFSLYSEEILPVILAEPTVLQKHSGYHGILTHTRSVVFRGIDYCLSLPQKVIPVILACACHDLAKNFNTYDETHGMNAVPIAKSIIGKLDLDLSPQEIDLILDAVANHTTGMDATNYISGCLWDADRTRLSWQFGYDEKFYYSSRAKQVASGNPSEYIDFMCNCLHLKKTNAMFYY